MPALLFSTNKQKGDAMKWCVIILAMLALELQANETGNLKGIVIDPEGVPAVGATVRVLGTPRGAITKSDGKFLISKIDVGKWDIQATLIGSEPLKKNVEIIANEASSLTFNLSQDNIELTCCFVVTKCIKLEDCSNEKCNLDSCYCACGECLDFECKCECHSHNKLSIDENKDNIALNYEIKEGLIVFNQKLIHLEIYNLNGKLVRTFDNIISISPRDFSPGNYIFKLSSENEEKTELIRINE